MILAPPANPLLDPALDVVTDADREWFEARPCRRYRLRPTALAELMPGEVMGPGSRTVVATAGSPLVRVRFRVGRPPLSLRQDTDRVCEALLLRLDAAGSRLGGMRPTEALERMRREIPVAMAASASRLAAHGAGGMMLLDGGPS